jgi:tetratricopeptide (TPR) repeat protein
LLAAEDRKAQAARFKALADEPSAGELPAATAVLLGGALEAAGDRDAGVGLLRRAAGRHPDDVWVNFALARALGRLRPALRQEQVRYYSAARALRPETAHDLAHLLDAMGRGAEAEATFRDLVKRQPDAAWHLACLGKCLKKHGADDEAGRVLDRAAAVARAALKVNPADATAEHFLGVVLMAQGKPAEAEAAYRAVVKLEPDRFVAHSNVGAALSAQGKWAQAEAEFRAALEIQPAFPEAHFNLGAALSAQRKPEEAEAEYRAALELQPDYADAHSNLGTILWNRGKPAEAEAEYRAALELNPSNADMHYNVGLALQSQGKPADAEAAFRTAPKLDPDHAKARKALGAALWAQGKLAEAEAEYRALLKVKPDNAEAHYNLGNTLRDQRRPGEAEAEYRSALALQSDHAEAHCNLGLLLGQLGRCAEALKELRRGHELGLRRPGWAYPSARWVSDAERLAAVDERLPGVIKGDDRPADAAEALIFARLCSNRWLHALAARLYGEAFHADPSLADDLRALHRHHAACAAALAGCGQSNDEPPLDDASKRRWRQQALEWLKADLTAWSKISESGPLQSRQRLLSAIQEWKIDADLAGLRDQRELAKIPHDEQDACRALWGQVDALLAKAHGSGSP